MATDRIMGFYNLHANMKDRCLLLGAVARGLLRPMTRTVTAMPETERATLIREAFRLEYFTVAWMVIEAGVAISAGLAARSITLLAFGVDSLIELASAGVLIWRLTVELRRGQSFAESAERLASRIGAILLFALAGYVVGAAGWGLWTREGQAVSCP